MANRRTPKEKRIVWEHGEIKSPPFSADARIHAGTLLRRLQEGELLGKPHSEPIPVIGRHCYELKVQDKGHWWRIFYRNDSDAIVIAGVLPKKSNETPKQVIDTCKARFARYDQKVQEAKKAQEAEKQRRGE
jgi:phage-related protein